MKLTLNQHIKKELYRRTQRYTQRARREESLRIKYFAFT